MLAAGLLLLTTPEFLRSQISEVSFGQIPMEDMEMTVYPPDLSADAVILENHASSSMMIMDKITVSTDRYVRIKIINTDGLDYANIEMPYGSDEKIAGLKAASYNLEDGKVVQTMVDKKSIYYENTSRYTSTLRFSFPNVRPGTVIEYKYTLESPDYFSLYTFRFQEELPVRRCNFRIEFPGYFEFKFVTGGDFKKIIYRREQRRVPFGTSSVEGFVGTWIGNNIPAYIEEPFSTGSDDYYTHIGFELSKIDIPGYYFEDVSPTYPKLSEKLLNRIDFGEYFIKNSPVRKKAEEIKAQGGSETDILRRIYTYVSGYMMWNGYNDFTASASMAKTHGDARGNSADINLMLLSMLRVAGIVADPVIMSTRENGLVNPFFALIRRFNHVVVAATADGKDWVIDATDPVRPFNMLPEECLNGQGWLVSRTGGLWIDLTNGEHHGKNVKLEMDLESNGNLKGRSVTTYESYDAWQVRKFCSLQGEEAYSDFVQAEQSTWRIKDLVLENMKNLEEPVTEKVSFEIPDATETREGIMYLNPVLTDRNESNEFYAEERISVIDLACPSVNRYSCTITIPEGWTVAELPQSVNLRMDGGGAAFSYNISTEGRTIRLDSEITFSTITYLPEKYATIRNFWSSIIRKQSEVIILRKVI
jgi:hypothetical protein